jgi:hypothetical protein
MEGNVVFSTASDVARATQKTLYKFTMLYARCLGPLLVSSPGG